MRSMVIAGVLAGAMAAPAFSFAQQAQPETRAHVQAQMQRLAQAGYRGTGGDTIYPADVQAAQQRTDERGAAEDTSGYGAPQWGSKSESGAREPKGPGSLYFGV
jgi:type II secretory pathway pseudopilin PulG